MPCSSGSSSCSSCLSLGPSCGWCQSPRACTEGGRFGPAAPSNCDNWAWYYNYCAGDAGDNCPKLSTCFQCLSEGRANPGVTGACGWCIDATGAQRCTSGQVAGPAVGARCQAWLFAQLDLPGRCPALPPSLTRTPSATPTWVQPTGSGASPSSTPTPGGGGGSSPSSTPGGGGGGSSGGSGGGGGGGGSGAAAALLPEALATAVAVLLTLGLLLACACGLAAGWALRGRLQGAHARVDGKQPRPGSVAFCTQDDRAPQGLSMQLNPVAPLPALRSL